MLVLWHVIYRACSDKVLLHSNRARCKQIAFSVFSLLSATPLPVIAVGMQYSA